MEEDNDVTDQTFFTGVIEGFYNRPWTKVQRLDLFKKLHKFGLNSYLYAPKDDAKHRSRWRELYTEEECKDIKDLIESCKKNKVTFFYGISPGLDIKYSDQTEIDLLNSKVEQIHKLGCQGFAILWDDIEPDLSTEDAKHFKSFSEAHCIVSNQMYRALDSPQFLFCPVEYCSNRAIPSVRDSEYLQTIGRLLEPNIHVFWTGSKVVSENITAKECDALAEVIKRKPIIWDNIHANDYDHQRLYLGPYLGRDRSRAPSSYLRGAMTNPNCEYTLNVPAMVTLAQWANNKDWDPTGQAAHRLAVREMLAEMSVGCYEDGEQVEVREDPENVMRENDVDLLIQMFWLPHSHGPRIVELLDNFRFCKDNAAVIRGWKKFDIGDQPDMVDIWMEKATAINKVCKDFFTACDKLTYINNRELLYDLNSYINNVRVILHACNNYLKWIGIEDCRKPLKHGPTLAGLPGGLAGDLGRLYPVQSDLDFPLKDPVTPSSSAVLVLPYKVNQGKHNKDLETLFDVEFKTFSEFLHSSSHCLLVRQKAEISALIAGWSTEHLLNNSGKDLCSRFFSKLVRSPAVSEKYSVVIKIFSSSPGLLDTRLLDDILESFSEKAEEVIVVTNEKNESLSRFLRLQNWKDLKTDFLISGQELLCKSE